MTRPTQSNLALSQLFQRLVGGAALAALVKSSGIALTFLVLLMLAQKMEANAYGLFATAFSLATILGFLATLGQHIAILRFWPCVDEQHGNRAAGATLRFSIGLALAGASGVMIICVMLSLIGWVHGHDDVGLVVLTGTMAAAFALSEISVAGLRARGSLRAALVPRELVWRLLVILGVLVMGTPISAAAALLLMMVMLMLVTIPQLSLLLQAAWQSPREAAPRDVQHAMRRSLFGLWGGGVVGPITSHVGTVVVGLFLGPVAAGAYFAADRIAKLLSVGLIGVNQIVGPMIARSWHGGRAEEVRFLLLGGSAVAFCVAATGFVAFVLLGRWALALFDRTYVEFFPVLLILATGQLVNALCGPNTLLLNMAGRERDNLLLMAAWGLVSVLGMGLGAQAFGTTGTAIAAAVGMAGWNLSAVGVSHHKLKVAPWSRITQRIMPGVGARRG